MLKVHLTHIYHMNLLLEASVQVISAILIIRFSLCIALLFLTHNYRRVPILLELVDQYLLTPKNDIGYLFVPGLLRWNRSFIQEYLSATPPPPNTHSHTQTHTYIYIFFSNLNLITIREWRGRGRVLIPGFMQLPLATSNQARLVVLFCLCFGEGTGYLTDQIFHLSLLF